MCAHIIVNALDVNVYDIIVNSRIKTALDSCFYLLLHSMVILVIIIFIMKICTLILINKTFTFKYHYFGMICY